MKKNRLLLIVAPALMLISSLAGANESTSATETVQPTNAIPANIFDPMQWFSAFGQPANTQQGIFNAAHPAAWMQFVDPQTHMQMHRQFANPAFYAQFMQPAFYYQFMNPENWFAWMNPAAYQKLMDPAVMNHWMNPASYMHVMDPSMYSQMMNPAAYTALIEPITAPVQNGSSN